jgi:hypothetical protein
MVRKSLAVAAATMMAASPCLAAELPGTQENGARRSGAVLGGYYKVPLGGGKKSGKPAAGLKMSVVHDYRSAGAQTARVVQADTFDLRLVGDKKATLYVGGKAMTGEQAKKTLGPVGTAVTVVIVVAAVVGGYYILRAIDDSGEE